MGEIVRRTVRDRAPFADIAMKFEFLKRKCTDLYQQRLLDLAGDHFALKFEALREHEGRIKEIKLIGHT